MAHQPELVTQILEAGAHVDLSGIHSSFTPDHVTVWVQLAASKGGHIIIGSGYEHALYAEWAKLGGKHVTVRF